MSVGNGTIVETVPGEVATVVRLTLTADDGGVEIGVDAAIRTLVVIGRV